MGRIHILTDQVANQIAAGEVVDRPASVVKELVENALDAGARRIRVEIEAGGRKRIRVTDDGAGMGRDDALLAFERHATSKIQKAEDLLAIATLGFRGEALPSIASVARLELRTRPADEAVGTRIEIHGGRIARVEEAGCPGGSVFTVDDLFFNLPARRKFLKSEQTETAHVAALVTHYALAHPGKHFELHAATHALLEAPPTATAEERVYQIFGRDTLAGLMPVAAERPFDHGGLAEPPPWRREAGYTTPDPGRLRVHGFASKPELQRASRAGMYLFVNGRLIRDRLLLHAAAEAYRNVLAPTSYPVLLLFLEMPPGEVDVNVHPSKTEVRFRQPTLVHDFVRDTLRMTLVKERPAAEFLRALPPSPRAAQALEDGDRSAWVGDTPPAEYLPGGEGAFSEGQGAEQAGAWGLAPPAPAARAGRFAWAAEGAAEGRAAETLGQPVLARDGLGGWDTEAVPGEDGALALPEQLPEGVPGAGLGRRAGRDAPSAQVENGRIENSRVENSRAESDRATLDALPTLKPLGQLRASFILAAGEDGLWIVDQHVAHERILFEKVLRERAGAGVETQRLLMPLLVDLEPRQMAAFARVAAELARNGFEAEPFGPRTVAVKAAPAGLAGRALERMLAEVLDAAGESRIEAELAEDLLAFRARVAASIACHAAIKVNTPLDEERMRWLLRELARTEHPTSCPHGRPIALRYAWKDIERAFGRA